MVEVARRRRLRREDDRERALGEALGHQRRDGVGQRHAADRVREQVVGQAEAALPDLGWRGEKDEPRDGFRRVDGPGERDRAAVAVADEHRSLDPDPGERSAQQCRLPADRTPPPSGSPLRPWPGRSTAMTSKRLARRRGEAEGHVVEVSAGAMDQADRRATAASAQVDGDAVDLDAGSGGAGRAHRQRRAAGRQRQPAGEDGATGEVCHVIPPAGRIDPTSSPTRMPKRRSWSGSRWSRRGS